MPMENLRRTSYAGSLFWPITAAFSVLSTLATVGSLLTPGIHVPEQLGLWLSGGMIYFAMSGILASMIGAFTLLVGGFEQAGELTVAGREFSRAGTAAIFGLCYAFPWLMIGALARL